jgi:hypothetical protein
MNDAPSGAAPAADSTAGADGSVHVSALLQRLMADMPPTVSLGWLLGRLHERSFGASMLVLGIVALLPLVSVPVGLILIPLAVQMILRRPALTLPFALDERPIPSHRLAGVLRRAIPIVRALETCVHPRAQFIFRAGGLIGLVVLVLALALLIPIPFSNIVPALCVSMIAVAYLERDGMILALSLIAAAVALGVAGVIVFGLVAAAF